MKTPSHASLSLSVFALIFFAFSAVSAQSDYKPAETNDAGVELAADFAVKVQAERAKYAITLEKIVGAEDQEPKLGARNFRLCLDVTAKKSPMTVQAIVTMDQYSNLKLISWGKSTCGDSAATDGFTPDTDYKPVANGDGGAGLAADFAVKEQAKRSKATIAPATIVKAEDIEPSLGARNFRLCLKTTVNGKATTAQTLVKVDQYSNHKLVSWTEMKCSESGGDDFTPVEKGFTAGVDMAADFAVGKHSEDTGVPHKLVEILKREEKGMFSMTYRICMKVGEGSETQVIQAIVTRDQYSNHKLVSWEHSTCGK